MLERIFVWGVGEVPDWLIKSRAIRATETELETAEIPDDNRFDWTVVLNEEESFVKEYAKKDETVKGFKAIDTLSRTTCTEPGKWKYVG